MRLFIGSVYSITCHANRADVLLIPAVIADHFAGWTPAINPESRRRLYLVSPNFMFYVSTLTNKVN